MSKQHKIDYSQLEAGYKFPPVTFKVDPATASIYLTAAREASPLYQGTGLVPPMAVAASAMAAWSENVSFPSGAIHVSQDFDFLDTVTTKDALTSHARVSKKEERTRFKVFTINFEVFNQKQKPVLAGNTTFLVPERSNDSKA